MKIRVLSDRDFRKVERSLNILWIMVNNGRIADKCFEVAINCIIEVASRIGVELEEADEWMS